MEYLFKGFYFKWSFSHLMMYNLKNILASKSITGSAVSQKQDFSNDTTCMHHLRRPFQSKKYDPKVDLLFGKQHVKTRQIVPIYIPPTKGYLRETCKSQNINPIYRTLSSPSVLFRS